MAKTIDWNEFLESAKKFLEISEKLNDSWELIEKNSEPAMCYLKWNQKLKHNFEILNSMEEALLEENVQDEDEATCSVMAMPHEKLVHLEYHVAYSISYQVPILLFKATKSDGSHLSLEESWNIFKDQNEEDHTRSEMLKILTQIDHPVLFKPFFALHPCKTAEILSNFPKSENYIVTFLSLVGPFVRLNLKDSYGLEFQN